MWWEPKTWILLFIKLNLFSWDDADIWFLAHLSFSDRLLSVVRLSVNFSHFHLLLQNHWADFNQTWYKAPLGEGNSSLTKFKKSSCPKPLRQFQPNLEYNILGWRGLNLFKWRVTPFFKQSFFGWIGIHGFTNKDHTKKEIIVSL